MGWSLEVGWCPYGVQQSAVCLMWRRSSNSEPHQLRWRAPFIISPRCFAPAACATTLAYIRMYVCLCNRFDTPLYAV